MVESPDRLPGRHRPLKCLRGRLLPGIALEGDIDAARELVEIVGPELAELFVYPGDRHLFTDSSLPSYDADATKLVVRRSQKFLDRVT
jgi:hypothetical protein